MSFSCPGGEKGDWHYSFPFSRILQSFLLPEPPLSDLRTARFPVNHCTVPPTEGHAWFAVRMLGQRPGKRGELKGILFSVPSRVTGRGSCDSAPFRTLWFMREGIVALPAPLRLVVIPPLGRSWAMASTRRKAMSSALAGVDVATQAELPRNHAANQGLGCRACQSRSPVTVPVVSGDVRGVARPKIFSACLQSCRGRWRG